MAVARLGRDDDLRPRPAPRRRPGPDRRDQLDPGRRRPPPGRPERPDDHPDRRGPDAVRRAGRAVRRRGPAHASTSTSSSSVSTAWTRGPGSPARTCSRPTRTGRSSRPAAAWSSSPTTRSGASSASARSRVSTRPTSSSPTPASSPEARVDPRRRGARARRRRAGRSRQVATRALAACPLTSREPVGRRLARLAGEPHRRYNPLIDDWVLVSAGRTRRPWLGAEEPEPDATGLAFDPDCYLCPGNTRANGNVNPDYPETFVFTNDFSALRPGYVDRGVRRRAPPRRGRARLVPGRLLLAAPRPDARADGARRGPAGHRRVGRPDRRARRRLPLGPGLREPGRGDGRVEPASARPDLGRHGTARRGRARGRVAARRTWPRPASGCCSTTSTSESGGPRVVVETDEWLVVVPFWAAWPFETLLIPKRPAARLTDLDDAAARRPGGRACAS